MSEHEPSTCRDDNDMPTEVAVLKREWLAMRHALAYRAAKPARFPTPPKGTVAVYVVGEVGSGKSGICGEVEIALKAVGLDVEWPDGLAEKRMTGADWQTALELYRPKVTIHEVLPHPNRSLA